MLLGISAGITFGYFTFHYKGCDQQALDALKQQAETDFPLSAAETADLRDEIRRHVLLVHDAEAEAALALKAAMA